MQEAEQKLLEVHMLLGQATSKQIDIDLKIDLLKKTKQAEIFRLKTVSLIQTKL